MRFLLNLLVIASLGNGVFGGLTSFFNATSDYSAAALMEDLFGMLSNGTKLFLDGNSANPLSVDITFWCANRNNPTLTQVMINSTNISSVIPSSKPLVFLIHGWLDNRNKNWIGLMKNDYLTFVDTNFCVVDWGNLAMYGYAIAAKNTYTVGQYLADFIKVINSNGIPSSKITLVGHSMGAQIAGHTGYNLGNGVIGAIYGLDPASPLFKMPFDVGVTKRLDKSNAQYVQMIITSRCFWGVCVGDGHENFYPNGGIVPQPNCIIPLFSNAESAEPISCSHAHAYTLFRMALNPSNVFNGKSNLLCLLFCKTNKMGIYSSRIGGDFYPITSAIPPFTSIFG